MWEKHWENKGKKDITNKKGWWEEENVLKRGKKKKKEFKIS